MTLYAHTATASQESRCRAPNNPLSVWEMASFPHSGHSLSCVWSRKACVSAHCLFPQIMQAGHFSNAKSGAISSPPRRIFDKLSNAREVETLDATKQPPMM